MRECPSTPLDLLPHHQAHHHRLLVRTASHCLTSFWHALGLPRCVIGDTIIPASVCPTAFAWLMWWYRTRTCRAISPKPSLREACQSPEIEPHPSCLLCSCQAGSRCS